MKIQKPTRAEFERAKQILVAKGYIQGSSTMHDGPKDFEHLNFGTAFDKAGKVVWLNLFTIDSILATDIKLTTTEAKDGVNNAGLIRRCDDHIFIDLDTFENNWEVLRTKKGGSQASVMFIFDAEHQALTAALKIAQAIGGTFCGKEDPRK